MADLISMLAAAAGAAAGGGETDPFFQDTVLLLHGDGTNGAQNNTFLDSSTNNFTITRNGNTTQGSFSPFSKPDGRWGNYFSTTDASRLSATVSAIGSGDFTLEFWLNAPTTPSDNVRVVRYGAFNASGNFQVLLLTSGVIRIDGNASTSLITGSVDLRFSGFHHVAITRSGTDLKLFVDGTQDGSTATFSANLTATALEIGGDSSLGALYDFDGWLSNVRTVTGTAVYTSAFTPPTAPLTAISGTSLLTCQSNRFVDNSTNNFAITAAGNVKVTPFSPFPITTEYSPSVNGGSGYFDGSDYLSVPDNAAWDYPGDFAIECWIYLNGTGQQHIYEGRVGSTSNALLFYLNSSTQPTIYINGSVVLGSSTVLTTGQWYYLVASRVSGTLYLFINGVSAATPVANSVSITSPGVIRVGTNDAANGSFLNGYLSGLKVLKGSGYSSVTVPTSPPSSDANTSLLCNFTNAGIFDNTGFNNLETVGNAQIDTTTKKYGTGSLEFDGTGDWLIAPNTPDLQLGTGNFTIEFWVYLATGDTGSNRGLVAKGGASTGFLVSLNTTQKVVFTFTTSTITSSGAITTNAWNHIAVVREGTGSNQTKIYIAGTNDGTGTVSTNFNQTEILYIGANRVGGDPMKGFIDDLRITKGIARYTAAFTPPTKAFPNIGE